MLKSRNSFIKLTTAIFATTLMMILGALALFTMEVHAAEFSYVDENGETKTHEATPLTGNETETLNSGWYVVDKDAENNEILYNNTLEFNGDVHLILADACELNIGPPTEPISGCGIITAGSIYIYGQKDSSGCLNINTADKGVSADGGICIYGGTFAVNSLNASGLYSANGNINILGGRSNIGGKVEGVYSPNGNITLGWTSKDDYILASSYMDKDNDGKQETRTIIAARRLSL
ncbi:MAG: hypothetical protein K6E88_05090 [Lachnospiraceae bacterium]|nr:hypothetical protein [Lachnospiraceae bacterium]